MLNEKVVIVGGGVNAGFKTKDKALILTKVMENSWSFVFLNVYFPVLLIAVECRMCIVCD